VRATGVCHRHRRNGHPRDRPLGRRDRSSIRCCTIVFRRPPHAHPAIAGRAHGCMARFTAPHAFSNRGEFLSVFGKPSSPGMRSSDAARGRCLPVVRSRGRLERRPCRRSFDAPPPLSRELESSTARPRPPLFSHPVKGEKRARSRTPSIERFHRSGASSPKTLSMPSRPSHRLATMSQRDGFLTWPRRIYTSLRRSRLGPTGSCARRLAAP
jgi:hypothetical protein